MCAMLSLQQPASQASQPGEPAHQPANQPGPMRFRYGSLCTGLEPEHDFCRFHSDRSTSERISDTIFEDEISRAFWKPSQPGQSAGQPASQASQPATRIVCEESIWRIFLEAARLHWPGGSKQSFKVYFKVCFNIFFPGPAI